PAPAEPAEPPPPDLTSVAILNAKTATPGVVTGGQPTEEQLQQAKASGVKIVVNLRTKGEKGEIPDQAEKVAALGMKYVHMPIESKEWKGLDEDNARKLAELLAEGPMLVHCTSGERVGALFALKAFYVDKQSTDEALEVGKAHGLSVEKVKKAVADAMARSKR
ncbi:MAG TPA: sulfur transferase domain-containing protein, partial [Kofleriaceae bacterium]|nr:sulfur transferase domain-containing protein [Kofleriaceae bacterium]